MAVTNTNFQREGKQDSCNDLLNRQNRGSIFYFFQHMRVAVIRATIFIRLESVSSYNIPLCKRDGNITCTMLLEKIKGFYHGITKIFLLVGSYTMLSLHF